MEPPSKDRVFERVLAWALFAGLAIGCTFVMLPFLSGMLWGAILVYSTWPVFTWLRQHLHLGERTAAALMVLLTALVLVVPIALAVPAGADDAKTISDSFNRLLQAGLPSAPGWLRDLPVAGRALAEYWDQWAADLSSAVRFFSPWFGALAEQGLKLLLSLAGGLVQFVVALVVAFFFWAAGDRLGASLARIAERIMGARAQRLIRVTGLTVRGVVYGILGTALVQGILTSLGLWAAGVPRSLLLGLIAGLLSVLPVGAPVVWIPASLWLLSTGHTAWGIALALYGFFIISGSDNVIRPFFIARGAQLPFLLTIIGVLGGALAYGLLGIFLGPVLLGVGYTLVVEFAGEGEAAPESDSGPAGTAGPVTARRDRAPVL